MTRASRLWLGLAVIACGCGQKGTITFTIEGPKDVSPLTDKRIETIALTNDIDGSGIGTPIAVSITNGVLTTTGQVPIGDVAVGHYDVRMSLQGGGKLLGLGRTLNVDVLPEQVTNVTLRIRKPIAFYGYTNSLVPNPLPMDFVSRLVPDPLMLIDTTLPASSALRPIALPTQALATASTHDGTLLLVGDAGNLTVFDTADLYGTPLRKLAVTNPNGAAPRITMIVVAPDDHMAVLLSDQGVSSVAIAALRDGSVTTLPVRNSVNARAAAFAPDSKTLAVLAGPSWLDVSCTQPQASFIYQGAADVALALAGPLQAPPATTDIDYDAQGTLLFSTPCGNGVVTAAGKQIVAGKGMYQATTTGDHTVAVTDSIYELQGIDPELLDNNYPTLPFGQIYVSNQLKPTIFAVPQQSVLLSVLQVPGAGKTLRVPLVTERLVAYEATMSADNTHLVMAGRLRYGAHDLQFFNYKSSVVGGLGQITSQCTLNVTRDVYFVQEVDIFQGDTGIDWQQAIKGFADSEPCTVQCTDCDAFRKCEMTSSKCTASDGYVPSGVSVLMGHQ